MMLPRITLPPCVAPPMKTPLRFPPILLFSTRLSLLVPTSPTPKLLLTPGRTVDVAEPFPLYMFNRTRLLWLLASHVPPQENPAEPLAFLTETFFSMSLSDVPET